MYTHVYTFNQGASSPTSLSLYSKPTGALVRRILCVLTFATPNAWVTRRVVTARAAGESSR